LVYNLEVAEGHTYFAGDPVLWGFALWAHDAGCYRVSSSVRSGAVRKAWQAEADLVRRTGEGTRRWTEPEIRQLLTTGRVPGYVTRLIGHVPHVAPEAWLHAIFPGLTAQQVDQISNYLGVPVPAVFSLFLQRCNGLRLFSKISIDGLRRNYSRTGDDIW